MCEKEDVIDCKWLDYEGARHIRIVDILLILEELEKNGESLENGEVLKELRVALTKMLAAK